MVLITLYPVAVFLVNVFLENYYQFNAFAFFCIRICFLTKFMSDVSNNSLILFHSLGFAEFSCLIKLI